VSSFESSVDRAVRETYSRAAQTRPDKLCCPTDYDPKLLEVIPAEIIERDYGCGDPSRYVRSGETVLDLGSGSGKVCYIAAQLVGSQGRVIGVDMNDEMLALARSHLGTVGELLGYRNISFLKARIQDLASDLEALERRLAENPVRNVDELRSIEQWREEQRTERPLIPDQSVDVVVSNCVLNLVDKRERKLMFQELFRVLKSGGRAVISDIVSDVSVPQELQADPELWAGCVSGAFREDLLLAAFEQAGFHATRILKRDVNPWKVLQSIEFRSVTVAAFKGSEGEGYDRTETDGCCDPSSGCC
jgi:SAM-dependent methyltransferase